MSYLQPEIIRYLHRPHPSTLTHPLTPQSYRSSTHTHKHSYTHTLTHLLDIPETKRRPAAYSRTLSLSVLPILTAALGALASSLFGITSDTHDKQGRVGLTKMVKM